MANAISAIQQHKKDLDEAADDQPQGFATAATPTTSAATSTTPMSDDDYNKAKDDMEKAKQRMDLHHEDNKSGGLLNKAAGWIKSLGAGN